LRPRVLPNLTALAKRRLHGGPSVFPGGQVAWLERRYSEWVSAGR
jgi:hypothetical protein